MPLVVFECVNDACESKGKSVEVLVKKVFDTKEESVEAAPVCEKCGEKLEWHEWVKNSFRLNFTPFH